MHSCAHMSDMHKANDFLSDITGNDLHPCFFKKTDISV